MPNNNNTHGEDEFPEDHDNELPEDLRGWDELTPASVDYWRGLGFSQSAIARRYGYTRQYVSWIKFYHSGRLTPREVVREHFPFIVPAALGQTSPYKRLRDHAEFRATGGVGMSDDKLSRLRGFYKKLRDEHLVIEYDPAIPPTPGVSVKGGWAFRKRRKADEDLLIRVNDHASLTDQGSLIWRFPPIDP